MWPEVVERVDLDGHAPLRFESGAQIGERGSAHAVAPGGRGRQRRVELVEAGHHHHVEGPARPCVHDGYGGKLLCEPGQGVGIKGRRHQRHRGALDLRLDPRNEKPHPHQGRGLEELSPGQHCCLLTCCGARQRGRRDLEGEARCVCACLLVAGLLSIEARLLRHGWSKLHAPTLFWGLSTGCVVWLAASPSRWDIPPEGNAAGEILRLPSAWRRSLGRGTMRWDGSWSGGVEPDRPKRSRPTPASYPSTTFTSRLGT
mgnify:CR=1 FL=1